MGSSKAYRYFLVAVICFIIVGEDLRLLLFSKSLDALFNVLICLCIIVLIFDLWLQININPNYLWSLLMFLNILSIASLVLDMGWVYYLFFSGSNTSRLAKISVGAELASKTKKALEYYHVMHYVDIIRLSYILVIDYQFL